jgi:predicted DNA binding CopG/RHH family protein
MEFMRKEYDFSKARRNPYAKRLKRPVTIRLDEQTIEYFKDLADETGIPYQTLINLYLRDCAATGRRVSLDWRRPSKSGAAREAEQ